MMGEDEGEGEHMTAAQARRERGRREMREQILAAARDVVVNEGVAALSMRGVARALGYSPAALYEYFPAKEDILQALYFEGANGLANRLRSAVERLPAGATTLEAFRALGYAYRERALEEPELYRFAFGNPTIDFTPSEVNLRCGWEAFDVLVGVARAGVERGDFVDDDPQQLAIAAWAVVHGFVLLEINGQFDMKMGEEVPADVRRATFDHLFDVTMRTFAYGIVRRQA